MILVIQRLLAIVRWLEIVASALLCRYQSSTSVNFLPDISIMESGSAPWLVSSARMPSFFIMSRRRLTDA